MDKVFNDLPTQSFASPPVEPMALFRQWFNAAVARNVREPGAMSLATSDATGCASNRIVALLHIRDDGLVFATHAGSVKGRNIAETGWASGALYWRETGQQLIVAGPTAPMPEQDSDALWSARPAAMHAMSVVSTQSQILEDEQTLRNKAAAIAASPGVPARPSTWLGYVLQPAMIEFWQSDAGRLHQRLRYLRTDTGWINHRLQP
jgi:dihydrophenazinedicarboxylate synthase